MERDSLARKIISAPFREVTKNIRKEATRRASLNILRHASNTLSHSRVKVLENMGADLRKIVSDSTKDEVYAKDPLHRKNTGKY